MIFGAGGGNATAKSPATSNGSPGGSSCGAKSSGVASQSVSSTNSQPPSSSNAASRLITVCVVGLSGTEREKGSLGVGKSCLCNRFVRPLEDDYRTDHISTLSQVDFNGRVINNDHWLYWGERTLFMDDTSELTLRVIEQTEFVDDESFQPLKAPNASQREPYVKRCVSTRLHSADKLMYICKEQLGIEHEYEQRTLPDGKANVDGFICVFDVGVGNHHNSPLDNDQACSSRQSEFVGQLLTGILKTKKPVVLVTTKNDEADERLLRDAERLLQSKKELRNSVPLVESSAHRNINVETAFTLLASLIEKNRVNRPKVVPYVEAAKSRLEILDVAAAAFVQKMKLVTRDDHRMTWNQLCRQLQYDPDFVHFCELCGQSAAQRLYKQHIRELRDKYVQRKLQSQIERLPDVVPLLLPDIATLRGKTWEDVLHTLPATSQFSQYFLPVGTMNNHYVASDEAQYSPDDPRLPAELLYTQEAEACFRRHLNSLEVECRRLRLQEEFAHLLANCSQVTPGKPLSDVKIFFLGKECFESLPEGDLLIIYDNYQNQIIKRARRDFVELLLEQVEEFASRVLLRNSSKQSSSAGSNIPSQQHGNTVGPPRATAPSLPGLSERDWRELHEKLQEDARYRQLNRMHQIRDELISQYISFVDHPLRRHCPAYPRCADALAEQLLANHADRSANCHIDIRTQQQSWEQRRSTCEGALFAPPFENHLNLLILGFDGLAGQFLREIRVFLPDDLFMHSGAAYSFDYRTVDDDSDDWLPSSNNQFQPQGNESRLVCVFSSRASLDYICNCLDRTISFIGCNGGVDLAEQSHSSKTHPLRGLPVVLLFACDPTHLDDLPFLQQQGARLADRLGCTFVGLDPPDNGFGQGRRSVGPSSSSTTASLFLISQLERTVTLLVKAATVQMANANSSEGGDRSTSANARRSNVKLTLCFMCGDDYSPELALAPLLNYRRAVSVQPTPTNTPRTNNAVGGRHEADSGGGNKLSVSLFSPSSGQKLDYDLTVCAYHTALTHVARLDYSHGYVLMYSAKRRASLAHLYCLAHLIPNPIPILVVAVGEVTEFFSDPATNSLITEGNEIADRVGARFITISKASDQPLSVFAPFFDEVWAKSAAVEAAGFAKNCSSNANDTPVKDEVHYAPLTEFHSGWMGGPASAKTPNRTSFNQWFSEIDTPPASVRATVYQPLAPNGDLSMRPPPPYGSGGHDYSNQLASMMTRSVYVSNDNGSAPLSNAPSVVSNQQQLPHSIYPRSNASSPRQYSSASQPPRPISNLDQSPSPLALRLASRKKISDSGSDGLWESGSEETLSKAQAKAQKFFNRQSDEKLQRSGSSISPAMETKSTIDRRNKSRTIDNNSTSVDNDDVGPYKALMRNHREPKNLSAAPLATPEAIEIGSEYMTVKDAISGAFSTSSAGTFYADDEQQYATVGPVLTLGSQNRLLLAPNRPPRRSDSSAGTAEKTSSTIDSTSSDSSTYDSKSGSRPGRKPTPHRSKGGKKSQSPRPPSGGDGAAPPSIAERVRLLNAAYEAGKGATQPQQTTTAPPIPPYTGERLVTFKKADAVSVLAQRRSASEESLLNPHFQRRRPIFVVKNDEELLDEFYALESDDVFPRTELIDNGEQKKPVYRKRLALRAPRRAATAAVGSAPTAGGFVRKVTSSFRFRRKKSVSSDAESRSTPQSPLLSGEAAHSQRVFVLPPFEASSMWLSNADARDQSDGQSVSTSNWFSGTKNVPSTSRTKDENSLAPPVLSSKEARKLSKEAKKSTVEAPARITGKKKSRDSGQMQLVPPDATLRDLATSDVDPVPMYVRKCVDFIEATGLQTEGIYRVPGNQAHVIQLEQKFMDNPQVSFYELDLPVNVVATSLKNFFSYLNEPLIHSKVYDELMEAMNVRQADVRLDCLRQILRRLPRENRAVLEFFIEHLRKVAAHYATTAMDHRNLAKCWWPTLLRPQFDSFETMTQMTQRLEEFVQLLLEHPQLLLNAEHV